MKLFGQGRLLLACLTVFCLALGFTARAETLTNVFTGNVTLDGDISDFFFPGTTNPLPGVCFQIDTNALPGPIPQSTSPEYVTVGLHESPSSENSTLDGLFHPSGFNQRKIMSAFNPDLHGGTIFIGIDLPGGTGTLSNPEFDNSEYGTVSTRGQVGLFDADGNGEADYIGRTVETNLATRYSACPPPSGNADVWLCDIDSESAGAIDDPRVGFFQEEEFYNATLNFGGGQIVRVVFSVGNFTAPGAADFTVETMPPSPVGAMVSSSTLGAGIPLGFDVEFAITNVNAAIPECDRVVQTVVVRSGSNSDGSGQGEDVNSLICIYDRPAEVSIVKLCPEAATQVGELLTFGGVVSNSGTITLTNVMVFNDQPTNNTPLPGFPITLGPGESFVFSSSYLVPADYCEAFLEDTLTVIGTSLCDGTNVTATGSGICAITNTPRVSITKLCPPGPTQVGTPLVFSGVVSNSGNIRLIDLVVFNDQPAPGTPVPGFPISLLPGESFAFAGSYIVPPDYCAPTIEDTLTVVGRSICGTNVTASDSALCLVTNTPGIVVEKFCPPDLVAAGDLLVFTGSVSNSGNITLTNIVVRNDRPVPNTLVFSFPLLAPGERAGFGGSYIVPEDFCGTLFPDTLTATALSLCGVLASDTDTAFCTITNNLIVLGPTNEVVCPGETVTLCAEPVGTGPFVYSWMKGTNLIEGATNNCLQLPDVTALDAGLYCVAVVSPCAVATNCALVTVLTNTTSTPLTDQVVCPGGTVEFCTFPSGSGPFSFTWFKDGILLPGETTNCLTLTNLTTADSGDYCVQVNGACNSVTNCVWLTVLTNVTAIGPTNEVVCPGTDINLCVVPFGTGPFVYTWYKGTNLLAGETGNCLVLGNVSAADAGEYCVTVDGACNSVTNCATVTVLTNTAATPLPALSVCPGTDVLFCTTPSGTGPFSFKWFRNGVLIPAETGNCLGVTNVSPADSGDYCVEVSGLCTTVTNCGWLTVWTNVTAIGPTNQVVCPGTDLNLCVTAFGTGPFSYLWSKGGVILPNETNSCLVIENAVAADGGLYTVAVSGLCNSVTNAATVTVLTNTTTTPLTDVTVCPGTNVTFSTLASGTGPFVYEWFRNGLLIGGASSNVLSLDDVTEADAGEYCVRVTGRCDTVTECGLLTVVTNTTVVGPFSSTNCFGAEVTLCATAFGTGPFTYVWFKGTNVIAGATNECLVFPSVSATDEAEYTVEVTGFCNSATNTASVRVQEVVFATPLIDQASCPGLEVAFSTIPSGTGPFSYMWFRNGIQIAGATSNVLTLPSVSAAAAGEYCVKVTGACASVTNCADLIVLTNTTLAGPFSSTNCPGGELTLCTVAFGSGPFSYAWYRGTNLLADATNNCLVLTNLSFADAAEYTVEVNGACNSATNRATVMVRTNVSATPLVGMVACPGDDVFFMTTPSGTGPFSYMWFRNGVQIPGAVSSFLPVSNVTFDRAGEYCVKVTGQCGSVTNCATLVVTTNTSAIGPFPQTACPGGEVSFCTVAFGTGPFTYTWFRGNTLLPETNNCLTLTNVSLLDIEEYVVIVDGFCNSVTNGVSLIVSDQVEATPIEDAIVCPGDEVTFTTVPGGAGPFTFEWSRNGVLIAGAGTASLTLSNVTAALAGEYCVRVTGACDSVTNCATLTVTTNLVLSGPLNTVACAGSEIALCVTPSGTGPYVFSWFKGPILIPGATNACLILTGITQIDAGQYSVRVAGACNLATNTATVTVLTNTTATPLTGVAVCPGGIATFCTTPSGTGPFTYAWFKNGQPIPGATTNCLSLTNVTAADAAEYCVAVTGFCTTVERCAPLTVFTNTTAAGPGNQVVCVGDDATLCTKALGTGPFTYRWLKNGTPIPAATNDCLVLTPVAPADGGTYCVEVTGLCGSVTNCATVTVLTDVTTSPLTNQVACPGGSVTFCTTAAGSGPITYAWFKDGNSLPGETNACLTITGVGNPDGGEYCVRVSGACNTVTQCALLTVRTNTTAAGPGNVVACPGDEVALCTVASGTGPFSYQWFGGTTPIPGATNACLILTNISLATSGEYCVRVSGACNTVTNCATVTVRPEVTVTPFADQTACPGGEVTFCVTAGGDPAPAYMWFKNGNFVPGQTNNCLTISNVRASDAGAYCVMVMGACNTLIECGELTVLTNTLAFGPGDAILCPGDDIALCTKAVGSGPFSYLWFRNGLMLAAETNNCLNLTNVEAADAGEYCVRVTGACGVVTNCATVTVLPEVVTTAIDDEVACPGETVTFCTTASGDPSPVYMWFKNGNFIPGATGNCLTLTGVTRADAGEYCVMVMGTCNAVVECATLTVLTNVTGLGPNDQDLCPGEDLLLCTKAFGTGPFSYMWFKDGVMLPGETNNCLEILSAGLADEGDYCVKLTGACGSVTNCATVTLRTNVTATPLEDQVVCPGATVEFCTEVSGSGIFDYIWFKNGVVIGGATNNCLQLTNVSAASQGEYTVLIDGSGLCNAVTNMARLTVLTNTSATVPDVTVCPGEAAVFCASVAGTGPFTYQWFRGLTALPGETNVCLTIPSVTPADEGNYCVRVTGACNTVVPCGELILLQPGSITGPANQVACIDQAVTFCTTAAGPGPFTYQWHKGMIPIPGATSNCLTLDPITLADEGTYCVVVQAGCNTLTNCATLSVPRPCLTITNLCPPGISVAGEPVTITGTVSNCSAGPLNGLVIMAGGNLVKPPFNLPAGGTMNYSYLLIPDCDDDFTSIAEVRGFDPCSGLSITNSSAATCPVICSNNPCVDIIKTADRVLVPAGGSVTYTYSVTNCGDVALMDVTLVDDNGTPGFEADDFDVITGLTLEVGGVTNVSRTVMLPVTLCDQDGDGTGLLVTRVLPDGNIEVVFLQDTSVNDNTYGVNADGWGGPGKHSFKNLTGSDQAEFQLHNGSGQLVLQFRMDYITAAAGFPSGYGSLGVTGGDGKMVVGNAASILSTSSSLAENLNKAPFLNNLAKYTADSPAPSDPNFPLWEARMIYTFVVDRNAFGASGFGGVMVVDQHNSPQKTDSFTPVPCDQCVTNIAVVTALTEFAVVTASDDEVVCLETPCLECDGKVSELTLRYNGSISNALIRVVQKNGDTVFNGIVQPGGEFSFAGTDNGSLGTEIEVLVNGAVNTDIHTSCSQPIGPGLVRGSFVVVAGSSVKGGRLCPLDLPPCQECDGKVSQLTLQYNGTTPNASIQVVQKNGATVFNGTVQPGGIFTFTGTDSGSLGTDITVRVNGQVNASIHTSCSQPIGPGLVAGDFLVIEGYSLKGGLICDIVVPGCQDCEGKVTRLTLQYTGGTANASVEVRQKDGAVVYSNTVQPGDTFMFAGTDNGTLGTEITVRVNGQINTDIHTSCSQPIGPGLAFGDFLVIEAYSLKGGKICEVVRCAEDYKFWKKETGQWPSPYSPDQSITSLFAKASLHSGTSGKSLLNALDGKAGSGDVKELLKQGVAAVLNAASTGITYGLTVTEVINGVNMALMSGNNSSIKTLSNLLKDANQEEECQPVCPGITPGLRVNLNCQDSTVFGGAILFSGSISNSGNVALENVVVTHSVSGPLLSIPSLAPGETVPYQGAYMPDRCGVPVGTSVTASGTDACSRRAVTGSASASCSAPCAPTPCIDVLKEIACLLPNDQCGPFGEVATGFAGLTDPAFCYRITVSNCGPTALVNLVVDDDQLGDLSPDFFAPGSTLAVGASVTRFFKMAWGTNTTNTVVVSGRSLTSGGQVASDLDQAVALVETAGIICQTIVTSPADLDGNPANGNVNLPNDGLSHPVTVAVVVCNPGAAPLTDVVVSAPAMAGLNCGDLMLGSLAPGACVTNVFCVVNLNCAGGGLNAAMTVTALVDSTVGGCGHDFEGGRIAVQSSCPATVVCQPAGTPGLILEKSADRSSVEPGGVVTYTYTVRNTGTVPLTGVTVVDDNGTALFEGDDFTVASGVNLAPGEVRDFSFTLFLPVTICSSEGGLPSGMLITQVLPDGNIRVSFIQSFDVNDNTYGVNAVGWGGPGKHSFKNLVGSDHAVFEFRNAAGQVVLEFKMDYIHENLAGFPSGYGTGGVTDGEGDMEVGSAAHVLAVATSLSDNLNKAPFLDNLSKYTTDSPSASDPNAALWEDRMIYTVVVDRAAFGASGYGTVAIIDQHNSPQKREVRDPIPCEGCITNVATAIAMAGTNLLMSTDSAIVCSTDPGPEVGGICPDDAGEWKKNTEDWPAPYTSGGRIGTLFSALSGSDANKTLLEAIDGKVGSKDVKDLLKEAVAGVLNAARPGTAYPFEVSDVIGSVNAALADGDKNTLKALKDLLKEANGNDDCSSPPAPAGDCDTDGKPNVLTLRYNGQSCAQAQNSQPAGKTSCSGTLQGIATVRIVATDSSTPPSAGDDIFFDGTVVLGASFEVRAAAAGATRFGSNTYLFIYNGAALVQTIQIHTSCSAPLIRGESFGSLVLEDYRIQ